MGNIVLLDDLTINKIAAGEVIERPASVIKEMVENSIDAGSTSITVEIKNGGISYIKVTDNGKGIAKDDLEIAFERHATSKIRSADDLDTVTSMGFRGEALASIAAIANVELVSKTAEQEVGYRVVVEGGDLLEQEEAGCRTGTTITVRNLFFNTPVRYKFLKKDYTESGYVEDVVTRIALVNPNISIRLINSGKTVIQTNGSGDIKNVIYSIYGKDIANSVMKVEYDYEDIKISGVIGKPEIARSNRSNQLFFVNKRHIKDKTVTAATEQAYKGLIPIGKFGFVILNIDMNPAKVDVNVHPAKLEVRFQEESKVFQAVYHAIKDTLLKAELVSDTPKKKEDKMFDRNALTFEERLKIIKDNQREKEREKQSGGLFSFRKQHEKEIEKYTDDESKIKTNLVEDLYKSKQEESRSGNNINSSDKIDSNGNEIQLGYIDVDKLPEANVKLIEPGEILKQLNIIKTNLQNDIKESTNKDSSEEISKKLEDVEEKYKIVEEHKEKLDKAEEELNQEKEKLYSEEFMDTVSDDMDSNENGNVNSYTNDNDNNHNEDNENENENEKIVNEKNTAINTDIEKNNNFNEVKENVEKLENNTKVVLEDFNEMYAKLFGTTPIGAEIEKNIQEENKANSDIENDNKKVLPDILQELTPMNVKKDNISIFENTEEFKRPSYKFVGIVFKTYIILELNNEMYILDQHAAHERINYEKVKKNYYSETTKDSQLLLLPDIITLTHKEMDVAKDNFDMFRQAGFELEEFGENTIKLTGVPTMCIDLDTKELFIETLDEINTIARTAKQEKEERFIATIACKASVKANMALTTQEVENLMDQLLVLPNPFTCPHGRPTVIKMTKYDIERKFARK